jgi:hypothetical protein
MLDKLTKRQDKSEGTSPSSRWSTQVAKQMSLETVAYSFFVIYLLLAVIFWNAGFWGRTFFVATSLGMGVLLLSLVVKFILALANAANDSDRGPLGLLFAKGVFDLALPLLLLKVVGALMMAIMPAHRGGIVCDGMNVIKLVYKTVQFQNTITYMFWGAVIGIIAILALGLIRKNR